MGFVRSKDEVEQIQQQMKHNHLTVRRILIRYRTDPEIVKRVLPPGLDPTDNPVAEAEVIEVSRSNCGGSFDGGGLYIQAQHEGEVGNYCIAMQMTTVPSIIWGRELFGEPKKLATVDFNRDGDEITAAVYRHETPIIEIDAMMDDTRDLDSSSGSIFHYKYLPDATGEGFQFDPTLVKAEFDADIKRFEIGSGSLSLGDTTHDPLGAIEIKETIGASYSETDVRTSQENIMTVDPDEFLPYAYGTNRTDDWIELENYG